MGTRGIRGWVVVGAIGLVSGCGDNGGTTGDETTGSGSTTEIATSDETTTTSTSTTTSTTSTTTATTGDATTGDATTGDDSTTTTATGGEAVCGDGVVEGGEACDDGNQDETDACLSSCVAASCGDGNVQVGVEDCDDGNQDETDVCLNTCVAASCGDAVVGPGEACDDGNQSNDDACTDACAVPTCGDGKPAPGEECDDGNADDTDACLSTCLTAACGDTKVQAGVEECDDGNAVDTDACTGTCKAAKCGDGIVQDMVEACDDGNAVDTDACTKACEAAACGDGIVQKDVEACDDGNVVDDDGCQADCTATKGATYIASGWYHTCALTTEGAVRCWGRNTYGQLGQGNTTQIGDDELPSVLPDVDLGGVKATAVVAGEFHTCALLEGGKVRCWGRSNVGQVGLSSTQSIGDNEKPWSVVDVPLGATAQQLAAGRDHTCALVGGGKVRCWGGNTYGQLGYGNVNTIGDNETPASAGDVKVGGPVVQVAAGEYFTCALMQDDTVRCWGLGGNGQLGQGNTANVGDDETPDAVPPLQLGPAITAIAAGRRHACGIAENFTLRCWGLNSNGQLGLANTQSLGDNEPPNAGGYPNLGNDKALGLALGYSSSCALVTGDKVRCWGNSTYGQIGQGNLTQIGDTEPPDAVPAVEVGAPIKQISSNWYGVCALGTDYKVRCWGRSEYGQLGYGNLNMIGDDELPSAAGPVSLIP